MDTTSGTCGGCGTRLPFHSPYCTAHLSASKPSSLPGDARVATAIINSMAYMQPTLRQRYAMAALTGMLARCAWPAKDAAQCAFEHADALIAAEQVAGE